MKGKHNYTVFTILFTAFFMVGSAGGMNLFLQATEERLLTESGSEKPESPVRTWQEPESLSEENEVAWDTAHTLTMGQMEEAVDCWQNRQQEVTHIPVEGQISLGDALENAEDWLIQMGFITEMQMEEAAVQAELHVGTSVWWEDVQREPYYSFWIVTVVSGSGSKNYAYLRLNAVTGKVWQAEVTMYGTPVKLVSVKSLNRFLELAGLKAVTGDSVIVDSQERQAFAKIKDSSLQAEMELRSYCVSDGGAVADGYGGWPGVAESVCEGAMDSVSVAVAPMDYEVASFDIK